MCLIIASPSGAPKKTDFIYNSIREGFKVNSQGAGYAFKKEGSKSITLKKGYFDVESLLESYKSEDLNADDEAIIHFRIPTCGDTNEINCHPFIVSENKEEMASFINGVTDKPVMAHNGGFSNYHHGSPKYSDTFMFVNEFIAVPEILNLLKRDNQFLTKIAKSEFSYNRVAFLFPEQDMILIGDFVEDQGVYFSNKSYIRWVDKIANDFNPKRIGFNYNKRDVSYPTKQSNIYPFDDNRTHIKKDVPIVSDLSFFADPVLYTGLKIDRYNYHDFRLTFAKDRDAIKAHTLYEISPDTFKTNNDLDFTAMGTVRLDEVNSPISIICSVGNIILNSKLQPTLAKEDKYRDFKRICYYKDPVSKNFIKSMRNAVETGFRKKVLMYHIKGLSDKTSQSYVRADAIIEYLRQRDKWYLKEYGPIYNSALLQYNLTEFDNYDEEKVKTEEAFMLN